MIGQSTTVEARMEIISCGQVMNRTGYTVSISFILDTVCLQIIYTIHKTAPPRNILKH